MTTSLPIELSTDKYHPNNRQFTKQLNQLKRLVVYQEQQLQPNQALVAKLHLKGRSKQDIANELSLGASTVAKYLNRPDVQELLDALRHLQVMFDGPSHALRRQEMWEIHIDNKDEDPRVSLSALKEMNNMDGIGKDKDQDKTINIQINQTSFPRGTLDQ